MAKSKTPCRYTLPDGTMCGFEALMPQHETHLCVKHLASGMEILSWARDNDIELTERDIEERNRDTIDAQKWRDEYKRTSVVYYIRFGERIKIGTTTNLRTRMSSLPVDKILVTERGDYDLEGRRHKQFKHCRVNGEWFKGDDEQLLAHIVTLRRMTPAQRNARWNGRVERSDTLNDIGVSRKLAG